MFQRAFRSEHKSNGSGTCDPQIWDFTNRIYENYLCVWKTLLQSRKPWGALALNTPNRGLERSCRCCFAGPRLAQKVCFCSQTPIRDTVLNSFFRVRATDSLTARDPFPAASCRHPCPPEYRIYPVPGLETLKFEISRIGTTRTDRARARKWGWEGQLRCSLPRKLYTDYATWKYANHANRTH